MEQKLGTFLPGMVARMAQRARARNRGGGAKVVLGATAILLALWLTPSLTAGSVAHAGASGARAGRAVSKMGWVAGGEISALTLYRDSELRQVMAAQKAARLNTIYVTVKQFDGRLWYYTDAYPDLMATPAPDITYTPWDNPLTKIIDAAHAQKPRIAVMVLFQAFLDRHAAWDLFPEARIGRSDYVDPAYVPMQDYLINIAVDLVRRYPVDGISLDFVRYPDGYSDGRLPYTRPGTRGQVITEFVRRFAAAIRKVDPSIDISANIFPLTALGQDTFTGQDLAKLVDILDWVSPMNYPYDDNLAGDRAGLAAYQARLVQSGIARAGRADALKPAVRAFFGYDMEDVAAQIDGVRRAGGTGAIVYAYDFDIGWDSRTWAKLAAHMPERWWERHFRDDKSGPVLLASEATGHGVSVRMSEPAAVTVEYALDAGETNGGGASNGFSSLAWRKATASDSHEEQADHGFAREHTILLPGLEDGRRYLYRVLAVDRLGNRSQSGIQSFTASARPAGPSARTSAPLEPEVTGLNDVWATIKWQTPRPATARVEYGRTTAYGRSIEEAFLKTAHALRLTDLEGDTLYHYRVISVDAWGQKQVSADRTFRTPKNLAKGRPAFASSVVHAGFEAHEATDGSIQTRWCSVANSDPQWITVDLGEVRPVEWVGLEWEYAYARGYAIEVSTDGRDWKTVHETENGRGGREDIRFNPEPARYVRVTGTKRGTGLGYSLWEIKILQ